MDLLVKLYTYWPRTPLSLGTANLTMTAFELALLRVLEAIVSQQRSSSAH
jgi:hypothetical protein